MCGLVGWLTSDNPQVSIQPLLGDPFSPPCVSTQPLFGEPTLPPCASTQPLFGEPTLPPCASTQPLFGEPTLPPCISTQSPLMSLPNLCLETYPHHLRVSTQPLGGDPSPRELGACATNSHTPSTRERFRQQLKFDRPIRAQERGNPGSRATTFNKLVLVSSDRGAGVSCCLHVWCWGRRWRESALD